MPGRAAYARRSLAALVLPRVRGRDLHGQVVLPGLARLPNIRSQSLSRRTSWLRSVDEQASGGGAPAHPYLARQMSDVGFRQTSKVRTLGCARSLSLLPIYALAR